MKLITFLVIAASGALAQPTLNLSIVNTGPVRAGSTLQLRVSLSGSSGFGISGWQVSVKSSSPGVWSLADGAQATSAGKSSTCALPGNTFNCIQAGMNINPYSDGVVGTYSLTIPTTAAPGNVSITMSSPLAVDTSGTAVALLGSSLNFMLASPISPCDLDGNDLINVVDVGLAINQVLGLAPSTFDLDGDGKTTVVEVGRIVYASVMGTCRVGI